jgi:hypothetical protein
MRGSIAPRSRRSIAGGGPAVRHHRRVRGAAGRGDRAALRRPFRRERRHARVDRPAVEAVHRDVTLRQGAGAPRLGGAGVVQGLPARRRHLRRRRGGGPAVRHHRRVRGAAGRGPAVEAVHRDVTLRQGAGAPRLGGAGVVVQEAQRQGDWNSAAPACSSPTAPNARSSSCGTASGPTCCTTASTPAGRGRATPRGRGRSGAGSSTAGRAGRDRSPPGPRMALQSLPPLVKGYLRVGATFGDGAVVDRQFGTSRRDAPAGRGRATPRGRGRSGAGSSTAGRAGRDSSRCRPWSRATCASAPPSATARWWTGSSAPPTCSWCCRCPDERPAAGPARGRQAS